MSAIDQKKRTKQTKLRDKVKPVKPVKSVKPKKPKKPIKAKYVEEDEDFFATLADNDDDATIRLDRTGMKIAEVMNSVENEIQRAVELHGPMNSLHEGYAVILEEMDELWDQVKLRAHNRDLENIREEAIQIAAMAARLVVDLL